MANSAPSTAWWLEPIPTEASSTFTSGLSAAEAKRRLTQFGPNAFVSTQQRSILRQYLSRFSNPLVIILLAASAISALSGEVVNFVIISCIVMLSVTLDFVQEYRANAAAEKLRHTVAVRTRVRRDGTTQEVAVTEVVPGDVVELCAGDLIPADARVIEARDFFVKQALLTGELYPVEKHAQMQPAPTSATYSAWPAQRCFCRFFRCCRHRSCSTTSFTTFPRCRSHWTRSTPLSSAPVATRSRATPTRYSPLNHYSYNEQTPGLVLLVP